MTLRQQGKFACNYDGDLEEYSFNHLLNQYVDRDRRPLPTHESIQQRTRQRQEANCTPRAFCHLTKQYLHQEKHFQCYNILKYEDQIEPSSYQSIQSYNVDFGIGEYSTPCFILNSKLSIQNKLGQEGQQEVDELPGKKEELHNEISLKNKSEENGDCNTMYQNARTKFNQHYDSDYELKCDGSSNSFVFVTEHSGDLSQYLDSRQLSSQVKMNNRTAFGCDTNKCEVQKNIVHNLNEGLLNQSQFPNVDKLSSNFESTVEAISSRVQSAHQGVELRADLNVMSPLPLQQPRGDAHQLKEDKQSFSSQEEVVCDQEIEEKMWDQYSGNRSTNFLNFVQPQDLQSVFISPFCADTNQCTNKENHKDLENSKEFNFLIRYNQLPHGVLHAKPLELLNEQSSSTSTSNPTNSRSSSEDLSTSQVDEKQLEEQNTQIIQMVPCDELDEEKQEMEIQEQYSNDEEESQIKGQHLNETISSSTNEGYNVESCGCITSKSQQQTLENGNSQSIVKACQDDDNEDVKNEILDNNKVVNDLNVQNAEHVVNYQITPDIQSYQLEHEYFYGNQHDGLQVGNTIYNSKEQISGIRTLDIRKIYEQKSQVTPVESKERKQSTGNSIRPQQQKQNSSFDQKCSVSSSQNRKQQQLSSNQSDSKSRYLAQKKQIVESKQSYSCLVQELSDRLSASKKSSALELAKSDKTAIQGSFQNQGNRNDVDSSWVVQSLKKKGSRSSFNKNYGNQNSQGSDQTKSSMGSTSWPHIEEKNNHNNQVFKLQPQSIVQNQNQKIPSNQSNNTVSQNSSISRVQSQRASAAHNRRFPFSQAKVSNDIPYDKQQIRKEHGHGHYVREVDLATSSYSSTHNSNTHTCNTHTYCHKLQSTLGKQIKNHSKSSQQTFSTKSSRNWTETSTGWVLNGSHQKTFEEVTGPHQKQCSRRAHLVEKMVAQYERNQISRKN